MMPAAGCRRVPDTISVPWGSGRREQRLLEPFGEEPERSWRPPCPPGVMQPPAAPRAGTKPVPSSAPCQPHKTRAAKEVPCRAARERIYRYRCVCHRGDPQPPPGSRGSREQRSSCQAPVQVAPGEMKEEQLCKPVSNCSEGSETGGEPIK